MSEQTVQSGQGVQLDIQKIINKFQTRIGELEGQLIIAQAQVDAVTEREVGLRETLDAMNARLAELEAPLQAEQGYPEGDAQQSALTVPTLLPRTSRKRY